MGSVAKVIGSGHGQPLHIPIESVQPVIGYPRPRLVYDFTRRRSVALVVGVGDFQSCRAFLSHFICARVLPDTIALAITKIWEGKWFVVITCCTRRLILW